MTLRELSPPFQLPGPGSPGERYMEAIPTGMDSSHVRHARLGVLNGYWIPLLQSHCSVEIGECHILSSVGQELSWVLDFGARPEEALQLLPQLQELSVSLGWGPCQLRERMRSSSYTVGIEMRTPWEHFFPNRLWYQRWAAGAYALSVLVRKSFPSAYRVSFTDTEATTLRDQVVVHFHRSVFSHPYETDMPQHLWPEFRIPKGRCMWRGGPGAPSLILILDDLLTLLLQELVLRKDAPGPEVLSALCPGSDSGSIAV